MPMDQILLGKKWDPATGRISGPETWDLHSHITMIAPTGAGKGVTVEMPNLLIGLREMSVLSVDPSGQNAAVCAAARRRMGHETTMLNPFNLHVGLHPDLEDVGFNPLAALPKPEAPNFMLEVLALGDSSISSDNDSQPHFPNAARGLMSFLMGFVRLSYGPQKANLGIVRDLLTGEIVEAARAAVATGHRGIASLANKYTGELNRELQSIISTAEVQTKWLLDTTMQASLSRHGVDFARMQDRKVTTFLILPAGTELETHGVWFRLVVTCALNAFYRRASGGGVPVLLMLSEFAQLGKVPPVRAAFGQARKYNLRLFPVLQNWSQLTDIYGEKGAWTFIANSGCLIGFNPGIDVNTAEFFEKLGGHRYITNASASPDPTDPTGVRTSASEGREPVWSADRIRDFPEFHALVWKRGQARPEPVYCEHHWDIPACRRVARTDPYHP